MINVTDEFTKAIKSPEKKISYKTGVSWNRVKDNGEFIYTDETAHCSSFKVSRKASKHPWGVVTSSATISFNNASKRYFPGFDSTIGSYVGLPNRPLKISIGANDLPVLPGRFQQLEYIESTGTQYIDTLYYGNLETKIVVDGSATGLARWFGDATTNDGRITCLLQQNPSGNDSFFGNKTASSSGLYTYGERSIIETSKDALYVDGVTKTPFNANTQFTTGKTLTIFRQANTTDRPLIGKIYSAKIYDNGIIVRNFIPAVAKARGKNLFNPKGDINADKGQYSMRGDATYDAATGILTTTANSTNSRGVGQKFTDLAGKTITFSATLEGVGTSTDGQGTINILQVDNNDNITQKVARGIVGERLVSTVTVSQNTVKVYATFITSGGVGATFSHIQLEESSTATPYEPYFEAGEVGLYDIANDLFYINQGTGTFTAGPAINNSVDIFTGFSDRPEVSLIGSEMTMTAHDILGSIGDTVSALGGQTNKRADELIGMLLEEAGIPSTSYELERSTQPVIGYCAPNNKNILDLIDDLCQAEQYLLFADGSGKIHGWNAYHQATISGSSWDFDLNNSTSMDFSSTNVLNDVLVRSRPYQPVPYAKIFSLTSASEDTLVPANSTLVIWSSLSDADNNEIFGIDVDIPIYNGTNTSNYLTNTAQDGSGSDNHGAISVVENLVLGSTIKTTFRNSSSIPTYITQLEFFGTSAQRQDYTSKRAVDKTSIATYGHNPDDTPGQTYEVESEYIQSDLVASQVATRLVVENSSPFSQLTIGTFIVPQLEFGDLVEISAGSLIEDKPMFVMGWEFEASSNAKFKQKLSLDESNQGNYFILDSSTLDGGKVLAP